jgi:hypothetical protein
VPRVYSRRRGASPEAPAGAVYVGRPTPFGNPFMVGRDGTQGECVELYRTWIMAPQRAEFRAYVQRHLRGKDLMCWCAPKPCHADVLLEVANDG